MVICTTEQQTTDDYVHNHNQTGQEGEGVVVVSNTSCVKDRLDNSALTRTRSQGTFSSTGRVVCLYRYLRAFWTKERTPQQLAPDAESQDWGEALDSFSAHGFPY